MELYSSIFPVCTRSNLTTRNFDILQDLSLPQRSSSTAMMSNSAPAPLNSPITSPLQSRPATQISIMYINQIFQHRMKLQTCKEVPQIQICNFRNKMWFLHHSIINTRPGKILKYSDIQSYFCQLGLYKEEKCCHISHSAKLSPGD